MGGSEKGGQGDRVSRKVAVLSAFAVESRRLQPCPDVERSTQRPPARGGERFLSGHFSRALPPFGSAGGSGKKKEHDEEWVKMVEKLQGKNINL